jgi:hypothetical protein
MEANGFLQTPATFLWLAAESDGLISQQDGVPAAISRMSLDGRFTG